MLCKVAASPGSIYVNDVILSGIGIIPAREMEVSFTKQIY